MKATPALCISVGPSRSASALICVAWLATAALSAWLPGTAALRGALVIGIGTHAILTMRHWATPSASRAIIELDSDRAVRLTERTGCRIEGMVQPYVGALLTTLVVRPDGKRRLRTVAILPDMLARGRLPAAAFAIAFGARFDYGGGFIACASRNQRSPSMTVPLSRFGWPLMR
jgi:hypothetical protein